MKFLFGFVNLANQEVLELLESMPCVVQEYAFPERDINTDRD